MSISFSKSFFLELANLFLSMFLRNLFSSAFLVTVNMRRNPYSGTVYYSDAQQRWWLSTVECKEEDSAKCSNYGMPSVTRTLNTSKDCPEKRFSGNGFQKLREFFIYMEIRKFVFKYCPSFISPSNSCVCMCVWWWWWWCAPPYISV